MFDSLYKVCCHLLLYVGGIRGVNDLLHEVC